MVVIEVSLSGSRDVCFKQLLGEPEPAAADQSGAPTAGAPEAEQPSPGAPGTICADWRSPLRRLSADLAVGAIGTTTTTVSPCAR